MTNLLRPFDGTNIRPFGGGSGQLPVGDRIAIVIESSEIKATQKDDNQGYVQFNVRIVDGEHVGGKGPIRLNLYNTNPKSVEIAEQKLVSLCLVTGIPLNFGTNLDVFVGRTLRVDVQPQANDANRTDIFAFYDINGNPPGKQATPVAPAAPAFAPQAAPQQAFAPQPGQAPIAFQGAPASPNFPASVQAPTGAFPGAQIPQQSPAGFPGGVAPFQGATQPAAGFSQAPATPSPAPAGFPGAAPWAQGS